jgi:hypothetical protein
VSIASADQKQQEVETFLAWLRQKFPVDGATIEIIYNNIKSLRVGVEACVYLCENIFKIELAMDREMRFVLRSVAHEYEHVRQVVNEKIPMKKIKEKQELAAWGFAMYSLGLYRKEE